MAKETENRPADVAAQDSVGGMARRLLNPAHLRDLARRSAATLREQGAEQLWRDVTFRVGLAFHHDSWRHRADIPLRRELKAQRAANLQGPLVSVVVPVYNTPENFFRQMVKSVQRQTYANWQLVLVDASDEAHPLTARLGQQLAAYYGQAEQFSAWGPLCLDQLAAAFLQLFFVLLCGFFAAGPVLLGLFFAAKGLFWGFCAANILQQNGAAGLLRYWVWAYLPALCLFFLCLWLAGYAVQLSGGLFQSVFGGGAPRGQLHAAARRLGVRFGVALLCAGLLSVVLSAFGAFAARWVG